MPEKNTAMFPVSGLLLGLLISLFISGSNQIYAKQKQEPKPYKLTPTNIDYCKTNKDEVQIRIKLKLLVNNPFQDRMLIHPLGTKYLTLIRIYKNAEGLSANKPESGVHIGRYAGFLLKKSVEKMEASDLFSFFTILGPSSSYEETIDYLDILSRQEYSSFGDKNYYLKVFFEAYLPDEIEGLIKERMKPFNPIILGGFSSEPILVEIKDFNSLFRCE